MRILIKTVAICGCGALSMGAAFGQGRGAPEWMTAGADAQRTAWIRTDPKISVAKLSQPGFALTWKIKLNEEPTLAATLDRYIGYRGFRSFALMGSPSGQLTAIDTDINRIEWQKKLEGPAAGGAAGCPGGMTANVARTTTAAFPMVAPANFGGGGGRGGPAKSGVGAPGEGAVTIAALAAASNANAARGRGGAAPGAPGAAARGPAPAGFGRAGNNMTVLASDGSLHTMYVSNGEEPAAPIPFLPANADAQQLTVIGETAYAATTHGCGGAANGVWAVDMSTKQVVHWTTTDDLAGGGFAFGGDSTVFAATTGGSLVALDPKTLEVKGTYKAGGQGFNSYPVVFEFKGKAVVAAPTREGQLHLVDGASLTGAAFPAAITGPMATWEDASGTRWIAAPSKDTLAAWKVVDQGGAPALESGWNSPAIGSPMGPIVINGVVFSVSNSPHAVLHAIDASSGKELWSSGKTMTAAVRAGSLSGSGSQLYLGTSDGTIYAFGFPIEH